jgi:hypothetical protein
MKPRIVFVLLLLGFGLFAALAFGPGAFAQFASESAAPCVCSESCKCDDCACPCEACDDSCALCATCCDGGEGTKAPDASEVSTCCGEASSCCGAGEDCCRAQMPACCSSESACCVEQQHCC